MSYAPSSYEIVDAPYYRRPIIRSDTVLREFVIEPNIDGVGELSSIELSDVAKPSKEALSQLTGIRW
jgi:hypothetical protein